MNLILKLTKFSESLWWKFNFEWDSSNLASNNRIRMRIRTLSKLHDINESNDSTGYLPCATLRSFSSPVTGVISS